MASTPCPIWWPILWCCLPTTIRKRRGRRPPYGHQRFETAASLVLGLLLLAVGVGMVWSAVVKLENPESVPQVHSVALWVAGGAGGQGTALSLHAGGGQKVKSSMLVANAWHARSGRGLVAGGGRGHCGQPGGLPHPTR